MARIDLGDVVLDVSLLVKDVPRFTWHTSAPRKSKPGERVPRPGTYSGNARKDLIMDVKVDNTVDISVGDWTDEFEHPVPAPEGVTAVWTLNEGGEAIASLTDNGDGTATLSGVGPLGSVTVHGEVTFNGRTATGDALYVFVAGDAERFEIKTSEPRETTPDV